MLLFIIAMSYAYADIIIIRYTSDKMRDDATLISAATSARHYCLRRRYGILRSDVVTKMKSR